MNLGGPELLIVLAVVILLFGAGWVPKAARNLGRAKVELDKTQRQIADTKQQVIEATGIDQLDATIRKTNRALKTTPKGLLTNAATSAMSTKPVRPTDSAATDDELIEDAEIVTPDPGQPSGATDTNLNVDFSDGE